jgi:protein transport protein SEC61 subunit alpha
LLHNLFSKQNKLAGVLSAFSRLNGPNIYRLVVTIGLVFAAVYVQQYRLEIKLSSRKMRGFRQPYPIKLIYASNICLVVYTVIVANVYTISQITASYFPGNFLFGLIGKWGNDNNFNKAPTGGLAYYLSPNNGLYNVLTDPIHTAIYVAFLMFVSVQVSKLWIDISGNNAKDVAKQFGDQELSIEGMREESMSKLLNNYIPTAAGLGGAVLAGMAIGGDVVGVCGSGVGVMLAVTICYQYFEEFAREQ